MNGLVILWEEYFQEPNRKTIKDHIWLDYNDYSEAWSWKFTFEPLGLFYKTATTHLKEA